MEKPEENREPSRREKVLFLEKHRVDEHKNNNRKKEPPH